MKTAYILTAALALAGCSAADIFEAKKAITDALDPRKSSDTKKPEASKPQTTTAGSNNTSTPSQSAQASPSKPTPSTPKRPSAPCKPGDPYVLPETDTLFTRLKGLGDPPLEDLRALVALVRKEYLILQCHLYSDPQRENDYYEYIHDRVVPVSNFLTDVTIKKMEPIEPSPQNEAAIQDIGAKYGMLGQELIDNLPRPASLDGASYRIETLPELRDLRESRERLFKQFGIWRQAQRDYAEAPHANPNPNSDERDAALLKELQNLEASTRHLRGGQKIGQINFDASDRHIAYLKLTREKFEPVLWDITQSVLGKWAKIPAGKAGYGAATDWDERWGGPLLFVMRDWGGDIKVNRAFGAILQALRQRRGNAGYFALGTLKDLPAPTPVSQASAPDIPLADPVPLSALVFLTPSELAAAALGQSAGQAVGGTIQAVNSVKAEAMQLTSRIRKLRPEFWRCYYQNCQNLRQLWADLSYALLEKDKWYYLYRSPESPMNQLSDGIPWALSMLSGAEVDDGTPSGCDDSFKQFSLDKAHKMQGKWNLGELRQKLDNAFLLPSYVEYQRCRDAWEYDLRPRRSML